MLCTCRLVSCPAVFLGQLRSGVSPPLAIIRHHLSGGPSSLRPSPSVAPVAAVPEAATPSGVAVQRPKLHWTEEFKIRSPKVSTSRLRNEPVVPIDILSDAYHDRRVAFFLRRTPLGGPLNSRIRGAGKILSWVALGTLPYLAFCKWAGGTPLLGEMTTYAIPLAVAGTSLGYLGLNWALERAVLRRRIYSVALDEADPSLVYITTLPVGGWLHGAYRSYATRINNISVETTGGSWAKLRFKSVGEGVVSEADWLALPVSGAKVCVADERAMAAFATACLGRAGDGIAKRASDVHGIETRTLPSDAEIDRHLEATLRADGEEQKAGTAEEAVVEDEVKRSKS